MNIDGTKASISLEEAFFKAFKKIAREQKVTVQVLSREINDGWDLPNLGSSLRIYVIEHCCA